MRGSDTQGAHTYWRVENELWQVRNWVTGEEASRVSVLSAYSRRLPGAANNIFPPCLLPLITIRLSGNDAEGLGRVGKGHEELEWPPGLWKLAMCFAGRLRKAIWELAFS